MGCFFLLKAVSYQRLDARIRFCRSQSKISYNATVNELSEQNTNVPQRLQTSLEYSSSEGGQNSEIPVVCNVPEKNFTHNMLHYQTAHKSVC